MQTTLANSRSLRQRQPHSTARGLRAIQAGLLIPSALPHCQAQPALVARAQSWKLQASVAGDPAISRESLEASFDPAGFAPSTGPGAWYAADYRDSQEWIYHFSDEDLAELEAAVLAAQQSGKETKDLRQADFSLPHLGPKLLQIRDEVVHGRGFVLLKGLPVDRWTTEQSVIAYWAMGTFYGPAVSQNAKRHLVGHVKDIDLPGGHYDPVNRIYATRGAQPYHTDPSDFVGLLCLKQAKKGGISSWASSITVYNEMLKSHPDLVKVLAQPWYFDRKNEVPEGKLPYFAMPIFNFYQDRLAVFYENGFIQSAQRHKEVPRLTEEQLRAIEVFDGLASSDALRMDYVLQPGDIQLLHNHQIVHTRSEYLDFEEPELRRHLLRLWVSPENDWPLPEVFLERFAGSIEPGKRGGIHVPGYQPRVPLEAE